jgi:large subunit ribosomal protein L4
MAQITLKTTQGADAGNVELDDAVFGIQPNVPVMHQVVTAQLAKRRAGTQSTKTRSEVRGGGAKPYSQKGTGNARQGSTNSPHYTGGGIALGPKPRSYAQKTPKKMIKLATRSALSDRASEGRVLVIDSWGFDAPRTKDAKAALASLGVTGRALVVIDSWESPVALSFRNLPEVQLIKAGELNAYDILCNDWIVFEQNLLPTADAATTAAAAAPQGFATIVDADPAEGARDETGEPTLAERGTDPAEGAVEPEAGTDEAPYGAGSHAALEDDAQPAGFPIKGNASSMLYHVPGSSHYDRTIAEVWFDTEASAEAAGFQLPPSQRDDETTEDES